MPLNSYEIFTKMDLKNKTGPFDQLTLGRVAIKWCMFADMATASISACSIFFRSSSLRPYDILSRMLQLNKTGSWAT